MYIYEIPSLPVGLHVFQFSVFSVSLKVEYEGHKKKILLKVKAFFGGGHKYYEIAPNAYKKLLKKIYAGVHPSPGENEHIPVSLY